MVESFSASERPELPHLATFVRAAEHGSFTAAACALGITQAAVSQRIAALKRELRAALFDRRAGKIALTGAGERLYRYARQILDLHEQARGDLGGFHPAVSGDLAIAASSVPGECFLPALLTTFHARYPDVHVRATVSDSGAVISDVEKGRAPLGLIGQEVGVPTLESRPIGRDRLVLIVPPGHSWAACRTVALDALRGEPLVIREPGSGTRCTLEQGLARAGRSFADLNVALELGSNAAIKDAVRRGLGVAFLSRFCIRRELDAKELGALSVRGLRLTRQFHLVHHRRRPLSPAASVIRHFVEARSIGEGAASES